MNPKILVIRRDNIGDLVCTTPVFRALKKKFPKCHLSALVNSYNDSVLSGNPHIDEIYIYTKAKHRINGQNILSIYFSQLKLFWQLRKEKFDYVIIAGSELIPRALKFARAIKPKHIIGYTAADNNNHIDMTCPPLPKNTFHETEGVFELLKTLDITSPPGKQEIFPDHTEVIKARKRTTAFFNDPDLITIGVHISSRRLKNHWSIDKFEQLIRQLLEKNNINILMFWSPGDENSPMHPGDDQKAAQLLKRLNNPRIYGFDTSIVPELIAGLSLCSKLICIDGGATHVAAALGIPMVCLFGDSDETRWYPWGVENILLQKESRIAEDISSNEVFEAFEKLT